MDAFAICIAFLTYQDARSAFKFEIETGGLNVAAPSSDFDQNYFVISGQVDGEVWIDGVATHKKPRLVRQFVALEPDNG